MPETNQNVPANPAPVTLTAASILRDHRDAAIELQAMGRQSEIDRFAALAERYKDDPAFIVQQFADGRSVEHADSAWKDRQIEQLRQQVEKLQNGRPPTPGRGVAPLGAAPAASSGEDFLSKARALAKSESITLREAMSRVAKTCPGLYEAHVAATA